MEAIALRAQKSFEFDVYYSTTRLHGKRSEMLYYISYQTRSIKKAPCTVWTLVLLPLSHYTKPLTVSCLQRYCLCIQLHTRS